MSLDRIKDDTYSSEAKKFIKTCRELHGLEKKRYCKRCHTLWREYDEMCPHCGETKTGFTYRRKWWETENQEMEQKEIDD